MPLDYEILKAVGTTEERLRQIFTSSPERKPEKLSGEASDEYDLDQQVKENLEEIFRGQILEGIETNLKSSYLMMAVDLAWDSSIIHKADIPLVMYAQGRISSDTCIRSLEDLKCKDQYVQQEEGGKSILKMPKFHSVNLNLVRAIIGRRKAAQCARYSNLWPGLRYEPRGTSEEEKLLADCVSQLIDIQFDQYGYRGKQPQWILDMLIYPYCVVFPAEKWNREVEWVATEGFTAEEYQKAEKKPEFDSRVKREGVPLECPHPGQVFYDTAHPIESINSDTGCEYFGFHNVVRYKTVRNNPLYFNRDAVGYNEKMNGWYSTHSAYFSHYYTQITQPVDGAADINSRLAQTGVYAADMGEAPVFLTHLYTKLIPNQWRMGRYPWPVWMHFVLCNTTVIGAEIMPDIPGFVFVFNQNMHRLLGLSMAMEILPFQDQSSNFFSQLLETIKRDLIAINLINLDCFPESDPNSKKMLDEFENALRGNDFKTGAFILKTSFAKAGGLQIDIEKIFKTVRQSVDTSIHDIMTCIDLTLSLTERVMSMSPQEQAQFNPRETSATEAQMVVGTTENVYQHISDSIDEGRAAMKRYFYNARISLGSSTFSLPVINRYAPSVAEKLGFEVSREETVSTIDGPRRFTVTGDVKKLIAEYIFTSRDGSDRSSRMQAAQTNTQMLGIIGSTPALGGMVTKEQAADLVTSIIRDSGSGTDMIIQPPPGTGGEPLIPPPPAMPAQPPLGPEIAQVAPAR